MNNTRTQHSQAIAQKNQLTMIAGHFTSLSSAQSIIETETLRATHARYINEGKDLSEAVKFCREAVESSPLAKNYSIKWALDLVESGNCRYSLGTGSDDFVLSFFKNTDYPNQWDKFCPNNEGVCVEYDLPKLCEHIQPELTWRPEVIPCVYDQATKVRTLEELFSSYYGNEEALSYSSMSDADIVIGELYVAFINILKTFKSSELVEENEVRIPIWHSRRDEVRFQACDGILIPYLEVHAPRSLIRNMTVGPRANSHLAKGSLDDFFWNLGWHPQNFRFGPQQ